MDIGVGFVDVADAEFATGLRQYLHQANRAGTADNALVKTRFLIALCHQQKGIEPVLAAIAPADLDRVTKALYVSYLGSGEQVLEVQQVGLRIIRPLVHLPSNLGNRAIERREQLRVVRSHRPGNLST